MTDQELAAIAARHEEDAAARRDPEWPGATYGDSMHRDRGALLAEVQRLRNVVSEATGENMAYRILRHATSEGQSEKRWIDQEREVLEILRAAGQ